LRKKKGREIKRRGREKEDNERERMRDEGKDVKLV
jgi:hypothetical protein